MRPTQLPTVTIDALPAGAVLLDVREDDEWHAGHIESAVHIPMNQVPNCITSEPGLRSGAEQRTPGKADDTGSLARSLTGAPIVVVCKVGGRSAQVTAWLIDNGYDATNLEGGMLAWAAARRPMVSTDGSPAFVA